MGRPVDRTVAVARTGSCVLALMLWVAISVAPVGGVAPEAPAPASVAASPSTPVFAVNFSASDLPIGTYWTVSLNGSTESAPVPWIVFSEPNGTYTYSAFPNANSSVRINGTVSVLGGPVQVPISFGVTFGPGVPATAPGSTDTASRSSAPFWIAVVSIVFGLVGIAALVATRRERKRRIPRPGESRSNSSASDAVATPDPSASDDPLGHML